MPYLQVGKVTPQVVMSSTPTERESAHILCIHGCTYSNSMLNQPERASAWLPTRPHSQAAPPFCASQEAAPSILCLPFLIRSISLHLCLTSLTGGSCLPQARHQGGLQLWQGSRDVGLLRADSTSLGQNSGHLLLMPLTF